MSVGEKVLGIIIFIYVLIMLYLFNCTPNYLFEIGVLFVIVSGATFVLFLRREWVW